jgi:hypothetical protein
MTVEEYRARIRALGLTPCRASFNQSTLHQTREGELRQVPDPEPLSPGERDSVFALVRFRLLGPDH